MGETGDAMGQRKFAGSEIDRVRAAHKALGVVPCDGTKSIMEAYAVLRDMLLHGTNDGKPFVPTIPSGYREATAEDAGREDMQYWNASEPAWSIRIAAEDPMEEGVRYIVPIQPEIGKGYRVATDADKDRQDVEFWSPIEKVWSIRQQHLQKTPLSKSYHYRVPIDRIPTDDDAIANPRMPVMVRDGNSQKWMKASLLHVDHSCDCSYPFTTTDGTDSCTWAQCRFPYPGE